MNSLKLSFDIFALYSDPLTLISLIIVALNVSGSSNETFLLKLALTVIISSFTKMI